MTINVGLVTSDALVIGCDSIASVSRHFIDPMALDWEIDSNGALVKDSDGKYSLKFDHNDWQSVVTNTYGGVTKLFEIHGGAAPMVAATAGLAKLCDRSMASWAAEFNSQHPAFVVPYGSGVAMLSTAKEVCDAFLAFMRSKYEDHYKGSTLPEEFRDGPEFLVGGFGKDDAFPSLFRVKVKENSSVLTFGDGGTARTGISWNGQSDAVERFIRGYDNEMRLAFGQKISDTLGAHSREVKQYVVEIINQILDKTGQKMPDDVILSVPELTKIPLDWGSYQTSIDFANLPHQEAINLVSFLVLLQDGRARFARGVPTVGGRTHICIITREQGATFLNEPELTHKYTGFADDQ